MPVTGGARIKVERSSECQESSSTSPPPGSIMHHSVAHVILAARAQAMQLEKSLQLPPDVISPSSPSSSALLHLPLLSLPKLTNERSGKKAKAYSCSLCSFRTAQKQSLTQHILSIHDKSRPYECQWIG